MKLSIVGLVLWSLPLFLQGDPTCFDRRSSLQASFRVVLHVEICFVLEVGLDIRTVDGESYLQVILHIIQFTWCSLSPTPLISSLRGMRM